jgi:hypothetical protein
MKMSSPLADLRIAPRRRRGLFARIRHRLTEYDEPTYEEARSRILSRPGFFASLSPEVRDELRHWKEPQKLLGPSHLER